MQKIMLKVAPVSAKNLSLVNSSVRKISPALAGKCIAVAVACAGMATEPEKVRLHFSFLRKYRVQYTCVLCWSNNCETCTRHWQCSEKRGKQGDFWNGRCRSFCRSSSRQWEQGSYFCESWRCDHRVVASIVPQCVRSSNRVRGCLVVSCAYRFSHKGRDEVVAVSCLKACTATDAMSGSPSRHGRPPGLRPGGPA
jgi:hypothetical protein